MRRLRQEGDELEAVNGEPVDGFQDKAVEMIQKSGDEVKLQLSRPRKGFIKVVFPDGKHITSPRAAVLQRLAEKVGYNSGCTCKDGRDEKCWYKDVATGEVYVLPLNVPGLVPSVWRKSGEDGARHGLDRTGGRGSLMVPFLSRPGEADYECWIPLRLEYAPEEFRKAIEEDGGAQPSGLPASLPKNWWARRVRVSALQRKVAYLALKAQWKWNEAAVPDFLKLPVALSEKVVMLGFAETTYCGADVCLWVLRWACENTRTDPPAITLEIFASYVTAAMAKFHPRDSGPFLWPLHDKDIASAIAMCEYVGGDAPWWRKVLWGLRIVQPPGGTVLEECILDHYGREVGYVFAWANLFTRSLWVLTILCLFFYICGARAQLGGFQGVLWYVMQFCILCWAICLNALAGSRKSVLRSGGGGGFTNFRAQNNRTNEVRTNESSLPPGSGRRSRSERQAQEDKPTMQGAKTTALDALQRESWVTTGERPVVTANTHTWQDRRSSAKDALCPSRLMEGVEEVPQNRRREAAEKLQRALLKAKFLGCLDKDTCSTKGLVTQSIRGWETKQLKVRRLNPDYSECRRPKEPWRH
eukprot:g18194.t1